MTPEAALAILRDKKADTVAFRAATAVVCRNLVEKMRTHLQEENKSLENVVIVMILRAAFAFMNAAMKEFSQAPVAVLGMKRDEKTLEPHWYYENLPPLSRESILVIFDPMLATGGSAEAAIKRLQKHGANLANIYFVGIIAAPEGFSRIAKLIHDENILLGRLDEKLDERGMIVPGLGDFGDRFFGYTDRGVIDV